jgi:hypothetical protein
MATQRNPYDQLGVMDYSDFGLFSPPPTQPATQTFSQPAPVGAAPPPPPPPPPATPPQVQSSQMLPPKLSRGDTLKQISGQFGLGNIATNPQTRQQFLTLLQKDPRFAGSQIFGSNFDKLRLPDGTVIDYIRDVGGRNEFAWHVANGPGGGPAPGGQRIDYTRRGGRGPNLTPRLPQGQLPNGGFPLQNRLRQQTYSQTGGALNKATAGTPLNPNLDVAGKSLRDLISRGGAFDEQVTGRRLESVREGLDRQRKSQMDTLSANLADRGLLSLPGIAQGPEATGLFRTEQDLGSQFATASRDIFTEEMAAANERYAGAINQLTGLGQSEAETLIALIQQAGELTGDDEQRLLDWMISERGMSLGAAQLALEQSKLASSHALGVGRLGLDRDVAMREAQGADIDRILQILASLGGSANTAAGGYY